MSLRDWPGGWGEGGRAGARIRAVSSETGPGLGGGGEGSRGDKDDA